MEADALHHLLFSAVDEARRLGAPDSLQSELLKVLGRFSEARRLGRDPTESAVRAAEAAIEEWLLVKRVLRREQDASGNRHGTR